MIPGYPKETFFVPDGIYLLSHSVGCLPVSTEKHLSDSFFRPWANSGGHAWTNWLDNINAFTQALAQLFNSNAQNFCPQVNLSSALTKILFSLPTPTHRNKVVFSARDFPSIGTVLQKYCKTLELEPVMIPQDRNLADPQTWSDFLDEEVSIALITHVVSNTGQKLPIRDIVQLCRDRTITSIVDIAQSAGIIPVDLSHWQADFVIGSCVKWLCGGPGAGYLWVSDNNIHECQPDDIGWFSHKDPMSLTMNNFEYAPDARRFTGGTPSVIPFTLATESIKLMHSAGIEHIHSHNKKLLSRLASQLNVNSPCQPNERGGTFVVSFSNNQKALQTLTSAGVHCDLRSEGLRLSPHLYNSASDIDTLAELINPLLGKRR
ncbi:hypothetical protein GZ77_17845 [Endozoicomonas montiporae]|uniref:Aminotransferase class V domain-containing protein n=2 Tax=Endozoicomonas montiporae TaxID=1027273 RepID=A0A081N1S8_9GAMM|nr:aminotransferase class V-fold PLP-dependent enzyme [Endozoicomonas montiporae]AMO58657.1 kynureninase, putative [Endozoicomonas montiporae CL-33]KEQ12401.1 hypothetical protein GZ77_17845 [Endozoicomonas montiporae]